MLCCYKGVVASLVLVVGLLSVPVFATSDWMERPGTIGHALKQQDGTRVYLDAVYVAKNKPYQNPPYFVVREPFDGTALLMVLATPPPELRPWQTVDVEGTLATLPNGDRALVNARTFGYLDREYNLLYHGPLIKGLLRPTPWNWMADLTVYSSPDSLTILTEEDPPPGEPNPDPMPAAVELSTIALAKLEADGTMVTLSCKRIDPTAGTGYFTIAEDDNHNETLKVYYTTTVDTTDRLYRVTGTMKTYNSERILCVNSGPGTVFDPAVDQVGSVQTAALGTIAYVKTLPNETQLDTGSLTGKVVTAIFNVPLTPFFYIQEPVGSGYDYSGIKVVSSASVQIGDLVDIEGTVYGAPAYPECYISPSDVDVVGTDTLPRPVGMNNRATAAGSFGLQPDLYLDVTTDHMKVGAGLNPVGILVRAWGRYFTGSVGGNTTYYIDDGSGLLGSVSAYAHTGLGLWYVPGTSAPVWESGTSFVAATGILGAEWSDSDPQVPVPVLRLDSTPPSSITVTDDGTHTASTTQLHASWTASSDTESGAVGYEYAIGTAAYPSANWSSVRGWTSVGADTEVTATGLTLTSTTYYISVRAVNGAGLASVAASDGIMVDTNAPRIQITTANEEVERYDRLDVDFTVQLEGETVPGDRALLDYNPFNPNLTSLTTDYWNLKGVQVDAVINTPNGETIWWPCFWYQAEDDSTCWKLRFAPTLTGSWTYRLRVRYGDKVVFTGAFPFTCVSSTSKGFAQVRQEDFRLFETSADSEPLYLYGVCDATTTMIPSMASNGGNFTRFFYSSYALEKYGSGYQTLCRYDQGTCRSIDNIMDTAQDYGVYVLWTMDDWEYIGGGQWAKFPYYAYGSKPAPLSTLDQDGFAAGTNGTREIYKRKLRYFMARYGAFTSLLGIDLINEVDMNTSNFKTWHQQMGNFVHGSPDVIPTEWVLAGQNLSYTGRRLMVTSSNGSNWMDDRGIPWGDEAMDFFTQHDYAKFTQGWTNPQGRYQILVHGSVQDYPWEDTAVWWNRWGECWVRNYTYSGQLTWNKPHCVTEFGLIYRKPGDGGFPDWDAAYAADPTARHWRDAIWAGLFRYMWGTHWKEDYFKGIGSYTNGGEKYWVFKPLRNYVTGENLSGLTQETVYEGVAGTALECNNGSIQAMALVGADKAYVYVKNLTDSWYRLVNDSYHPNPPPTPQAQTATIKVKGLQAGTYLLEQWITFEPNITLQHNTNNDVSLTVGANGVAEFSVNVGTGLTSGYDWAYKLKRTGD